MNYLARLLALLLLSQIFVTRYYWHALLFHIAWGLIIIFGFWIAFNIFYLARLEEHRNPVVQQFGKIYTPIFAYTAIFQACIFMTLIFYVWGSMDMGYMPELVSFEWEFALSYASWFVYGLAFSLILFIERKWLSFLFMFPASWLPIIGFFVYENEMRAFALANPNIFAFGLLFLQLGMSALAMHAVIGGTKTAAKANTKAAEESAKTPD